MRARCNEPACAPQLWFLRRMKFILQLACSTHAFASLSVLCCKTHCVLYLCFQESELPKELQGGHTFSTQLTMLTSPAASSSSNASCCSLPCSACLTNGFSSTAYSLLVGVGAVLPGCCEVAKY
jgi:hypothetical protein